jgi:hypothetical protein
MSNKYLLKIATTIDMGPDGEIKGIHEDSKNPARKAKLVNKKPKVNKYLKGAVIGGAAIKAGVSAYAGKKLYDAYKAKKSKEQEKKASAVSTTKGEPGSTINANKARDALQTGAAVGLGMLGTKLYEKIAPKAFKGFGRIGRLGALAGSTLAADYATVRANNSIANKMTPSQTQANKL